MNRLFPLIMPLAMIGFIGCKDKDPTKPGRQKKAPPHVYYEYWLNESVNYMHFKTGSWWVYKNTQTSILDTLLCTVGQYDTIEASGNYGYNHIKYDYIRVVTKSKRFGKFYDVTSSSKNADLPYQQSPYFNFMRDKSAPGGNNQICYFSPELNGQYSVSLVNDDTTVLVNGIEYQGVKIFKLPFDDTYFDILNPDPHATINYSLISYAKNIGIIKYEIPDLNQAIELTEHHIIQ